MRFPKFPMFLLVVWFSLVPYGCADVPEMGEDDGLEAASLSTEGAPEREAMAFREALLRTVEAADSTLEVLARRVDGAESALDDGQERLSELREARGVLVAELQDFEAEDAEDLARRVSEFQHDLDRARMAASRSQDDFADVVETELAEVESALGVLLYEVNLLDDEAAEGYYDELRDLESDRDELRRELVGLDAGIGEDPLDERDELAEELLELRRELRELEYELMWGLKLDLA